MDMLGLRFSAAGMATEIDAAQGPATVWTRRPPQGSGASGGYGAVVRPWAGAQRERHDENELHLAASLLPRRSARK